MINKTGQQFKIGFMPSITPGDFRGKIGGNWRWQQKRPPSTTPAGAAKTPFQSRDVNKFSSDENRKTSVLTSNLDRCLSYTPASSAAWVARSRSHSESDLPETFAASFQRSHCGSVLPSLQASAIWSGSLGSCSVVGLSCIGKFLFGRRIADRMSKSRRTLFGMALDRHWLARKGDSSLNPQLLLLSMFVLTMIVTPPISAAEILEAARKASIASSEALQSAQGSGTFTVHRKNVTDKDEILWTDGSFELSYDGGQYYLDITYRKLLQRTRYTNADGQSTEKVVDWSPDRVVIVYDGQTASVVTFSPRINPTGCEVETFDTMKSAVAAAGFPIHAPAQPWSQVLNVDSLIRNLGTDAITVTQLDAGIARGEFKIKNSKNSYVQFDVDSKKGGNVVSTRTFIRPSTEPAGTNQLIWEQKNSTWFVKQFKSSHNYSRFDGIPPYCEHTVVTFDSFAPNTPIDDEVFSIKALPIPPGTRTLDRTR